jgi:hypothetical protein
VASHPSCFFPWRLAAEGEYLPAVTTRPRAAALTGTLAWVSRLSPLPFLYLLSWRWQSRAARGCTGGGRWGERRRLHHPLSPRAGRSPLSPGALGPLCASRSSFSVFFQGKLLSEDDLLACIITILCHWPDETWLSSVLYEMVAQCNFTSLWQL